MKQIGFGVLRDGQPTGLWPKPLKSALQYAKRQSGGNSKVEIVPVYIGAPLPHEPSPQQTKEVV
jgi:hypothetical protein